jgi:DNA polymerase-3 subunit alpha/error-prone DNA polymerase
VSEARRLGINILPPNVLSSHIRWQGQDNSLRVGFLSVKGVSNATMQRIVTQRNKRSFNDLADFFKRVVPDETEVRALVHCGALDCFSNTNNRAELLWQWSLVQKKVLNRLKPGNLFDMSDTAAAPLLPKDNLRQRLRNEFAVLGFLCDRHPMTLFEETLKSILPIKARHLSRWIGCKITLAGWLITAKVVRTKRGDHMEFLTFEDETDLFETTFFPEIYTRFCHQMDCGRPYLLYGLVEENWAVATLTVENVTSLL